mmetsp:Transcript_25152/g.33357  ORF Transcript_25152/g.33357 Transcript_25152/m.33357 type:complete len:409 (-) Transcript_25152:24-1250(-)
MNVWLNRYLEENNNDDNMDTTSELIAVAIIFSFASFVGNFGVSLTGFGMAIFFLFVYSIFEVAGLMECSRCGLLDAVFYQTLGMSGAVPLILYRARKMIQTNVNRTLLVTFIPISVVGTVIGRFAQQHFPTDIIRVIMGAAIIVAMGIAARNLVRDTQWYKLKFGRETNVEEVLDDDDDENDEESTKEEGNGARDDHQNIEEGQSDEHEESKQEMEQYRQEKNDDSDNSPNEMFQDNVEDDNDINKETAVAEKSQQQHEKETESLPHGKKLIFWGITLGFLSGFLGGLVGVRGPPVILFFLCFSYPKPIVRANGVLILFTNLFIRIVYYIIEDISGALDRTWFEARLWYLYVSVVVFGMMGVPVGQYVAERISGNQFKLVLCFMLLLSGLSNLIKGAIQVANRDNDLE